jgi:uncharacterized protein (TIGR02598 family)
MKHFLKPVSAFSLIEVTLALGVGAFCLIAVCGLLPVGVQINRNATSQTVGTGILASVIADLRATPTGSVTSTQYQITFGQSKTIYFDGAGQFATSLSPTSRYRLDVTFPRNEGFTHSPTYVDLKVTWPAAAPLANVSGSTEMFAAFDRN